MNIIKQTVPFLSKSKQQKNKTIFLIDKLEVLDDDIVKWKFFKKLTNNLAITKSKKFISADEAIEKVTNQYDSCLELMFSHQLWEDIREGKKEVILSYIIETSHYLAAASHRMASGVNSHYNCDNFFIHMLSEHTIEPQFGVRKSMNLLKKA